MNNQRNIGQSRVRSLRLLLATGLLAPLTSVANAEGNPKTGGWLASHWCSSCHADGAGFATDAAPPLHTIAQDLRRRDGWLRAWLADPHPPMPNLTLSRSEIDDIIAYLQSLAAQ